MRAKIFMALPILISGLFTAQSCRDRDLIPEDVMSQIYYDIYMTDEAVNSNSRYRRMVDTLRIYEPVFNRYGYTTDDYIRSVNTYLERPDKFVKVFEKTKTMLEKREAELQKIIEAQDNTPRSWTIIDSLEILTADGIHSGRFYKTLRMMFFQPDTCVPCSPVADSAFLLGPQSPFLLFSDSATNSDIRFAFYTTKGFMNELERSTEKGSKKKHEKDGKASGISRPIPIKEIKEIKIREYK